MLAQKPFIKIMKLVLLVVFMLFSVIICSTTALFAATYYIDFQNGKDTNSVIDNAHPWKHIPGTRTADDTADVSTCWGTGCPGTPTFSRTKRVPGGTVFKLKSGSIHNSSNGGRIFLSKDNQEGPPYLGYAYYDVGINNSNPVTFERDNTWGSGSIVFDGTNIQDVNLYNNNPDPLGMFFIRNLGGFIFNGVAGVNTQYDGIVIQNTYGSGIWQYLYQTDHYGGTLVDGITIKFVTFYNICTRCSSLNMSWESQGAIVLGTHDGDQGADMYKTIRGVTIDHVEIDGNYKYATGIRLGEEHGRVINATISNVEIHNLGNKDDPNDRYKNGRGIVPKCCQLKVTNASLHDNIKGADTGCKNNAPDWISTVEFLNVTSYNNELMGMGFQGASSPINTAITYYIINNVIYGNGGPGIKLYGGPTNMYIVQSTFVNNEVNVLTHPADITDTSPINVILYSNIFYNPINTTADGNVSSAYWSDGNSNYVRDSDYNSYVQGPNTYWTYIYSCVMGAYGAGSNGHVFLYGPDGPGHNSGAWYNFPNGINGRKAWLNDAHSKGTGASDPTLPPFKDLTNHDYTLATHYQGVNLSSKPWYTSDMGTDRSGVARTSWDIGAYEYQGDSSMKPPAGVRILPQ